MNDGREPPQGTDAGGGAREALLLRTWSDGEASVVQQLLEQYGIPCRVVSDITHAVYPFSVDGLGEVRVLVRSDRLDEAVAILAEHRRHALEIAPSEGGEPTE
jgi:hypothetical protein